MFTKKIKNLIPRLKQRGAVFRVEAMANLRASKTGVDGAVIWVSPGEFESKKSPHGPRIKVAVGHKITTDSLQDAVSITLTNPPRVLGFLPSKIKKRAIAFAALNRDALLAHWNGELDSEEVIKALKKLDA